MKKGAVLVITFGMMFVILALALGVISLMRQQAHVTEHHISRRGRLLAAQAGVVHAYESLRIGTDPATLHGSHIHVGNPPNRYRVDIEIVARGAAGCRDADRTPPGIDFCVNAIAQRDN